MDQTFPVLLMAGEDGWIVVECPTIPGCISQGRTREEALHNIREAIALCLEDDADAASLAARSVELVNIAA